MQKSMRLTFRASAFALVLVVFSASAATLAGRVVGVYDGDTITLLDASQHQYKIRLAGIDAPESKQAFATRSKENLSEWVYGREVVVAWEKHDRYGRTLGVVLVDGHDVNLEQVRAGVAWWYRQYAKEQLPNDRRLYELAENEARAAKRGLWADTDPTPPWNFRRQRRNVR
jgi:endonuclease YncB( thermonuclease family)